MTDFSEDEAKKLVEAFSTLGTKPKTDSPDDLKAWMREYVDAQDVKPEVAPVPSATPVSRAHFPKLVPFSGQVSKNEVTFDLWLYDVRCLQEENLHPREVIRQAVRNSLRGEAGQIAMRMGPKATLEQLLDKLEGVYGTVELGENLLSEFYAAHQKPAEDVSTWGCRLEDMLAKAAEKNQIDPRSANDMLRTKFWNGLKRELKVCSHHTYESVLDFDKLRVKMRAIEHEFAVSNTSPAQVNMSQPSNLEKTLATLSAQLKTLQADVDLLKSQKS